MDSKMILYRGSLKSCNYSCSYCPFAKHPSSAREMEKDRMDWMKFCKSLEERAEDLGRFALMVVPYGEALIHPWYWEGLAFLSRLKQAEAVGVQTNFSFSAGQAGSCGERPKEGKRNCAFGRLIIRRWFLLRVLLKNAGKRQRKGLPCAPELWACRKIFP